MPNFPNPFAGNYQRRMTEKELLRAIRQEIAGEQEAIYLYEAHADSCGNALAAKVFRDIAAEEKVILDKALKDNEIKSINCEKIGKQLAEIHNITLIITVLCRAVNRRV